VSLALGSLQASPNLNRSLFLSYVWWLFKNQWQEHVVGSNNNLVATGKQCTNKSNRTEEDCASAREFRNSGGIPGGNSGNSGDSLLNSG
jgi:hypothetical protein